MEGNYLISVLHLLYMVCFITVLLSPYICNLVHFISLKTAVLAKLLHIHTHTHKHTCTQTHTHIHAHTLKHKLGVPKREKDEREREKERERGMRDTK